ncbi:MAG TPA: metallophosphoesterase [Pirellulaceae bacterium]|jgi:Icc-related predicted phosphoesterase
MAQAAKKLRLAAVGDLHYGKTSQGSLQPLLTQINEAAADILLLLGDLTDYGHPEEAAGLAKELSSTIRIPIIGVLGNHDYESGQEGEVRQILEQVGVKILDGEACEVLGIGFAGVKGFCGGFGNRVLAPWGEKIVKLFVHEAIEEALKLESALSRLRTDRRYALLHYAPIAATVETEPLEIYPFLGCSRLEEPLNRYPLDGVFHGHAHHGGHTGKTKSGVPVYNVSLPLMQHISPDRPFHLEEIATPAPKLMAAGA